ncbi:hypothetical protein SAMN02745196_02006 [Clostridium collagenovorans DSM 3089]|uniref:IrrE N-terminal-like domain-containing protein n=1 Tax=Clostridium collagenovorans DSM 3089 TaxID=1121306 RepID=A0A1M5X5F8_9CLOT|nr:hypothetical protein [Clostridium collagenovorans]SHH94862.1 hypothetical protein SAMN02745196_02006 [Clostridium collagenovorans DSM 3089]
MSKIISSDNLEEVININLQIEKQIQSKVDTVLSRYNDSKVISSEKLAFNILKKESLIQIPINDIYFGGLVVVKENFRIAVINTAQPRVYQYFIAWHEIYHMFFDEDLKESLHKVNFDMELNERYADYFAAKMLLGDVYDFYFSLDDENFEDKIFRCMDVYKAPYKAILIQLYQDCKKFDNSKLKSAIIENFDKQHESLVDKFERLGLDTELVKPTYIYDVLTLENKIKKAIDENPEIEFHKSNLEYFKKISNNILKIKESFINEDR